MAQKNTSRSRLWLRRPLLLVWLAVQTAESGLAQTTPVASQIPSVFRPESTPAHSIYELSLLVLTVTGLIFAVVFGLILYAIVRYRRRSDDDGEEPAQVYGSTQVEVAWTVIPVLIVVVLSLTGARTLDKIQNARKPSGALDIIGDRPPMVVGVPLPLPRNRDGERTPRTGQRPRQPDADISQAAIRRRGSQLLDPSAGGQDRSHPQPRERDVVRTREARGVHRAMRRVLRDAAREDAAARLRSHA